MAIRVSIANEQNALAIDRRHVREVVRRTLRAEGIAGAEISVALVDDAAIHELNRHYLNHDYPTDVLSFLLADSPSPGADGHADDGIDGEVIVSTETAIRQAKTSHWSPGDELTLYLVHGLLHLCGYDDRTAADRRRMRARERDVLQFWGLSPHYQL